MLKHLIPFVLIVGPLWAAEPMDGAAFDAYTRGKTLVYGQGGAAYGVEEYLENQRVRWSFLDGQFQEGSWYELAGQICFLYEDRSDPQCWTFTQSANGLVAQFESQPDGVELYEADNANEPMLCLGPETGV